MKNMKDTALLMQSEDYKKRFIAEYWQTKIRYEKLKQFNTKIEAAEHCKYGEGRLVFAPHHDCPREMLAHQQTVMGEYLHILEMRAVIEDIKLEDEE